MHSAVGVGGAEALKAIRNQFDHEDHDRCLSFGFGRRFHPCQQGKNMTSHVETGPAKFALIPDAHVSSLFDFLADDLVVT